MMSMRVAAKVSRSAVAFLQLGQVTLEIVGETVVGATLLKPRQREVRFGITLMCLPEDKKRGLTRF
jgi:hypothetical protein